MLVKTVKGSVDYHIRPTYNSPIIRTFQNGEIFTLKGHDPIYEIFIFEQAKQTYKHKSCQLGLDGKDFWMNDINDQIIIKNHLLIIYNKFTKIGDFNIITQQFQVINSGLSGFGYCYFIHQNIIYECIAKKLSITNLNLYPIITHSIEFNNILDISRSDFYLSRDIVKLYDYNDIINNRIKPSYYRLPFGHQQKKLYYKNNLMRIMFMHDGKSKISEIELQRIQIDKDINYQYKQNNIQSSNNLNNYKSKFQTKLCADKSLRIFQLMPKQKIIRKYQQIIMTDCKLINQQFIIAMEHITAYRSIILDIVTARRKFLTQSDPKSIQNNLIFEFVDNKIKVIEFIITPYY